jgi:hypothetical protein
MGNKRSASKILVKIEKIKMNKEWIIQIVLIKY